MKDEGVRERKRDEDEGGLRLVPVLVLIGAVMML